MYSRIRNRRNSRNQEGPKFWPIPLCEIQNWTDRPVDPGSGLYVYVSESQSKKRIWHPASDDTGISRTSGGCCGRGSRQVLGVVQTKRLYYIILPHFPLFQIGTGPTDLFFLKKQFPVWLSRVGTTVLIWTLSSDVVIKSSLEVGHVPVISYALIWTLNSGLNLRTIE